MLVPDALRLCLNWGSLLAVVACGGRTEGDGSRDGSSLGGNANVTETRTSQGGSSAVVTSQRTGGGRGGLTSEADSGRTGGELLGGAIGTSTVSVGGSGGTAAASGGNTMGPVGGNTMGPVGGNALCPTDYAGGNNTSLVSPVLCGNGTVEYGNGEQCDDGNQRSGDGCSSSCGVESSWICPPGCAFCQRPIVCGDGIVQSGESCDDGNVTSGDGCSSTCEQEPGGYLCTPGRQCRLLSDCGNGILDEGEGCDDGVNSGAYTKCNPDCMLAPYCGDGVVQPEMGERCDLGAQNGVPGTSAYCDINCQLRYVTH